MKTNGGSVYVDPCIVDLGTSWRMIRSRPGRLTPRERAPVKIGRNMGGPHSQSQRYGKAKILDFTGSRTPIPRLSKGEQEEIFFN
jgi:hypothetical protein